MRVKKALVKSKNHMWVCGPECATLNNRMCLNELCNCGDPTTREMEQYAIDWFESTPVFSDLSPEAQQEAVQEMQAILDSVGDGVAPFYYAVQEGRTFAHYLDENNLEADESGPCDDTLYNNQGAFVLYVSTMGAIDCKYLAVAPTRGRSGGRLVNADLIADYINEITYSTVTYTFKDWDGTVLKIGTVDAGATPTAPADPTRPATAEYTYTFTGWSPTLGPTYEDITYTAQYEAILNTFTVVWKNYDGTVLETDTSVPYGETPTYNGATPTKASTAQYSYTFNGWNPSVEPATADAEYIAQFTEVLNTYTVVWKNYDGTVLETDAAVSYGTTPTYNGATPTKASTAQYAYTFNGWSPAVVAVTGNAEYTAQFTQTTREYQIIFEDYNGTTLKDSMVAYGTMPTPPADPTRQGYDFIGWSPTVATVTKDQVYTAQYEEQRQGYTILFSSGDEGGQTSADVIYLSEGDELICDEDNIYLNNESICTAEAYEGYKFDHWETIPEYDVTQPIVVQGDIEFYAYFGEDEIRQIKIMPDRYGQGHTWASPDYIEAQDGDEIYIDEDWDIIHIGEQESQISYEDPELLLDYWDLPGDVVDGDMTITYHVEPHSYVEWIDPDGHQTGKIRFKYNPEFQIFDSITTFFNRVGEQGYFDPYSANPRVVVENNPSLEQFFYVSLNNNPDWNPGMGYGDYRDYEFMLTVDYTGNYVEDFDSLGAFIILEDVGTYTQLGRCNIYMSPASSLIKFQQPYNSGFGGTLELTGTSTGGGETMFRIFKDVNEVTVDPHRLGGYTGSFRTVRAYPYQDGYKLEVSVSGFSSVSTGTKIGIVTILGDGEPLGKVAIYKQVVTNLGYDVEFKLSDEKKGWLEVYGCKTKSYILEDVISGADITENDNVLGLEYTNISASGASGNDFTGWTIPASSMVSEDTSCTANFKKMKLVNSITSEFGHDETYGQGRITKFFFSGEETNYVEVFVPGLFPDMYYQDKQINYVGACSGTMYEDLFENTNFVEQICQEMGDLEGQREFSECAWAVLQSYFNLEIQFDEIPYSLENCRMYSAEPLIIPVIIEGE